MGWKSWFWLTLLAALVLRLGLAFEVQRRVSKTPGRLCLIAGDAEGYWELAGTIAEGKDYSIYDPPRRMLRMPGFPFLLAIARLGFGNNPFAARILLVLSGTLACGLTYWLGRELASDDVGVLAALYTAVSPSMAVFSVVFLSETAFAATMVGSLIAAAKLLRPRTAQDFASTKSEPFSKIGARDQAGSQFGYASVGLAIVTGCLIGLATYMRPTWILVGPGIACLVLLFRSDSIETRVLLGGLVCLGLSFTLAPWTIRNAYLTGHFIPTTLWVGPSLYDGLHPKATGESDMQFYEDDALMQTMSEYDMDREYRRRAWEFAAADPVRVLTLALKKQWKFWSPVPNLTEFESRKIQLMIQAVSIAGYLPLMVLACFGAWSARQDLRLLTLTAAPILYFAALHLLFVGSLRYRLPAEYPLAVLAAVGLTRMGRKWLES